MTLKKKFDNLLIEEQNEVIDTIYMGELSPIESLKYTLNQKENRRLIKINDIIFNKILD